MSGSWRDQAFETAQDDLDALLNVALGFAREQLRSRGEFYPYAAAITKDGESTMIAAMPSDEDHPDSTAVLNSCVEALVSQRDRLRAGATVADVHLPERSTDAIRVDVEHVEGPTITILLPYSRKRFRGSVEFGELAAQQGTVRIWGSGSTTSAP